MRTRVTTWAVLALLGAAAAAAAQQPPDRTELPGAYHGSDLDRALQARDWGRAEQLLVAAIDREPRSPRLLAVLGGVFLAERKPLNAAIAIKKADAIAPIDNRTRFTLVLAYISMQHGDWARPELDRLIAADPANTTYQYWLGRLDYDAGQYAAAAERFERIVAADPAFVRAYDNLGLCYEALGEIDKALERHQTAVALNRRRDKSPWPPLNLGILRRTHGDLHEAEALLREAVGYDAGLAQAHYQLGVVLEQEGRLEDAITELTAAADLDASYADPQYALMRVYRRLGRTADASKALAAFERLHGRSPEPARP